MKFTLDDFEKLIKTALGNGYYFSGYKNSLFDKNQIILRHDVDFSLEKAYEMAEIENSFGVKATYFILITSNFYNVLNKKSKKIIKKIIQLGHNIGLHYDEMNYDDESLEIKDIINSEVNILESIFEIKISSVSMHRPSKAILNANIKFDSLINTYSDDFFKKIEYISDSRMNWKKNPFDFVGKPNKGPLQLLVHPFWYNTFEKDILSCFNDFLESARINNYTDLNSNFSNLESIFGDIKWK